LFYVKQRRLLMVFDHIGFNVTNFLATKEFLVKALKPLGIGITSEGEGWAMIGREGEGNFWFGSFGSSPGPIHIAFAAKTREDVRKFYRSALEAGGKDNGAPSLRPQYHANYYGAFIIGPDGHNIEAVCHLPEAV
jgi:catechol 2,3-dioxygenase-like lactoylglutathione lyase family enzyme